MADTDPEPWPILVISLADDHARRARIAQRLSELGLTFSFLDAIDGRAGLPAACEPLVDRAAARQRLGGREMTDAELACALSHRLAYRQILDRGLAGAVILEDDALPRPRLRRFLEGRGYRHANLTLLDHGQMVPWVGKWAWLPGCGLAIPVGFKANYATGYALARRGAEILLEAATPVTGVADWPVDLRRVGARAWLPRPVGRSHDHVERSHIEPVRARKLQDWRRSAWWRRLR